MPENLREAIAKLQDHLKKLRADSATTPHRLAMIETMIAQLQTEVDDYDYAPKSAPPPATMTPTRLTPPPKAPTT